MNRRPVLKLGIFAGVAALLTAIGGFAFARGAGGGCGGRGDFMKRMVSSRIDDALDYAKVDDTQKEKIHVIRDRLFTEFEANRGNRMEKLGDLKELFLADKLDPAKVASIRAEHQAKMQKMGDVVEQAFIEAHDTLTTEQRAKIVEYAEKHRPRHWKD